MLTCISCSNSKELPRGALPLRDSPEDDEEDNAIAVGGVDSVETPNTRQAFKALTAQIKDMALKASGAYRHCKPCAGSAAAHSQRHHRYHHGYSFADSGVASGSERFHHSYRRAYSSTASTPRLRRGGSMSSGDATPSVSTRTDFLAGDEESAEKEMVDGGIDEEEEKEWVAQVEPGVLISFLSLPQGGNELKRIRFSREMFTKWRAQRWWAENYEKVMELYNVQKFNHQAVPLPSTPSFDDENSKEDNLATPQFNKDHLPHGMQRPLMGSGAVGQPNYHGKAYRQDRYLGHHCYDSVALTSTPKFSSISGAKTEISSIDASVRTSSSPEEVDRSSELSVSVSNASEQEREWVEEDEPGIYITVRALPGGKRELRRVRFSRERFGEMHARLWWEENRARIHDQYL